MLLILLFDIIFIADKLLFIASYSCMISGINISTKSKLKTNKTCGGALHEKYMSKKSK